MPKRSPWERVEKIGGRELLSDELFTKLDRAHSSIRDVFLFFSRQDRYQREAAELGRIAEELNAFTKRLAGGR